MVLTIVRYILAFIINKATWSSYSGAPAREARQRSTMAKKIW